MNFQRLLLVLFLSLGTATSVMAQITTVDTLSVPLRTSFENGYLSRVNLDRAVIGARPQAMGGAGLALLGGSEYQALNPAAMLGMRRPQLQVEAKIFSGSAGVNNSPKSLDISPTDSLTAANYRVRPKEDIEYHSIALGMPVVILGGRGALGITYRRAASAGVQDETRVELRGTITNEADATYGLGDLPSQGMDAITVGAAREITPWLDAGVNLNWQGGTIHRSTDIGIAVFGFEFLGASSEFAQDVSGFNVDLGGRLDFGRLKLAATAYFAHDLDFTGGSATIYPLPDPQAPDELIYIKSASLDHTIEVPTMLGLGAAIEVTPRFTVVGDFWLRPWDKSTLVRARVDPVFGFADPSDSTTFSFSLPTVDGELERINAGFENTNSIRIGGEYVFLQKEGFRLPLRAGFRSERLTTSDINIPAAYADYYGLLAALYHDPDNAGLQAAVGDLLERNQMVFGGPAHKSNTITFGFGVEIQNFGADLTVEKIKYNTTRFFLQDFDPLLNPIPASVSEDRSLTNISLAARMRF